MSEAVPSTLPGKVVPPPAGRTAIDRPALMARLDDAAINRLTLVVADAGAGKTTALAAWAESRRAAWYSTDGADAVLSTLARGLVDALRLRVPGLPGNLLSAMVGVLGPDATLDDAARAEAGAGLLAGALHRSLIGDLAIVIDNVDSLPASSAAAAFLGALTRQAPGALHVIVAGRDEPPFGVERLRGRGEVTEVTGADLALDRDEVAATVDAVLGEGGAEMASTLLRGTRGWPAGVRLIAEALRPHPPADRPEALRGLLGHRGPLGRYLAEEVLATEDDEVRALLATATCLPRVDEDLLGALGHQRTGPILESLAARGLFLIRVGDPGWYTTTPLVRDAAGVTPDVAQRRQVRSQAVAHLEARGRITDALRCALEAGVMEACARLIADHGSALVAAGEVGLVLAACTAMPDEHRDPRVARVHGEACQVRGDWDAALAYFDEACGTGGKLDAGLAWRMGVIHYLGGRLETARQIFTDADTSQAGAEDLALLHAWWAAALWRAGDVKACRDHTEAAHAAAVESGSARALATAHTALAMLAALEGDRRANDAHYLQALDAAERAGDILATIRIRANRASHFLDEGFYAEAMAEADLAIELAAPAGYAAFHSLALLNRAEAATARGRLDEALADFRAALSIEQRLGAVSVGYPLLGLADVHRARGDLAAAEGAYREALALAEESGDTQLGVPVLAGLARVRAEDDPDEAAELAERAVEKGPGMGHAQALLAAASVAITRGETSAARAHLDAAQQVAGQRRDRPAMAEALELRAMIEPDRAIPLLEEAVALWRQIASPLGEARARVALGHRRDDAPGALDAEAAEAELSRLGVRAVPVAQTGSEVMICCLGGFRVLRDGAPLPVASWRSRKARDLLKVLTARRGRPLSRESLIAALWPDEDPRSLGNRLAVALSTARAGIDPDKAHPSDHIIAGDKAAVWIDLEHCTIDVERFLDAAEHALRLHRSGAPGAREALAAAERRYTGDFCEEDPYEEWAAALREEARAVYVSVTRALAEGAAADGDFDAAVRYHLRLLERDGFDEGAHLGLVDVLTAAGRHGEARRHYRTYTARMGELDIEPSPFPS